MQKSIVLSPSNYNKLTKARGRLQAALGEIAGSGMDYEHVSGMLDGLTGLIQELSGIVDQVEVKAGRVRATPDANDPRTPEEIAEDAALAAEHGVQALV